MMNNYEAEEIVKELNNTGKKRYMKEHEIKESKWNSFMQEYGIHYNKSLKIYFLTAPKAQEQEKVEQIKTNDNVNTTNVEHKETIDTVDVRNFVQNNLVNKNTELNKKDNKEETIIPIEITKVEVENKNKTEDKEEMKVENKTEDKEEMKIENKTEDKEEMKVENKTEDKEEMKVENNQKRRGRKAIVIKDGFEMYSQQLDKRLLKMLKFKAISEEVSLEDLISDLLMQSIEEKYFQGLKIV